MTLPPVLFGRRGRLTPHWHGPQEHVNDEQDPKVPFQPEMGPCRLAHDRGGSHGGHDPCGSSSGCAAPLIIRCIGGPFSPIRQQAAQFDGYLARMAARHVEHKGSLSHRRTSRDIAPNVKRNDRPTNLAVIVPTNKKVMNQKV